MELVPLTTSVLEVLAHKDADLRPWFRGVFAADRLPRRPYDGGYVVNTDPHDKPGQHWLGLWVDAPRHLEVFDSYGLPLTLYSNTALQKWFKQFPELTRSGQTLQALDSQACGHYTLQYLASKARGEDLTTFLKEWDPRDLVDNDRRVGQTVRLSVLEEIAPAGQRSLNRRSVVKVVQ